MWFPELDNSIIKNGMDGFSLIIWISSGECVDEETNTGEIVYSIA